MRALSLTIALVTLSLASLAHAQDRKKAEQRFNEASKAYAEGKYDQAVKGFLEAYQQVPTNPLLFNIGQAYRLSGDKERALSYYEKYVSFEPGGAQVSEAKDHIQKLREEVETERREKERVEQERLAQEQAEATRRADEERQRQEQLLAAQRAEARKAGSGLRTGGLIVGGAGVVALGVGVALAVSDGIDGKSAAALGVGGAALVAGGVMYFLGVKQRNDAQAAVGRTALVVPAVSPTSVGLVVLATF